MNTEWEYISGTIMHAYSTARLKVPGGWILRECRNDNLVLLFISDPHHSWSIDDE